MKRTDGRDKCPTGSRERTKTLTGQRGLQWWRHCDAFGPEMVAERQCRLCSITSHLGDNIQLVGVNSGRQERQRWLQLLSPVPRHSPVMSLSLSTMRHSFLCDLLV